MKTNFVPRLSRPCSQDWQGMSGDDKKRFCEQCQLHVHNISAMSPRERTALLSDRKTRTCIAYRVNAQTVEVRTGTWLLLQRSMHACRRIAAALAVLLPLTFLSGCVSRNDPADASAQSNHNETLSTRDYNNGKYLVGRSATPSGDYADGKITAGVLQPPPPLWRRILFFWDS